MQTQLLISVCFAVLKKVNLIYNCLNIQYIRLEAVIEILDLFPASIRKDCTVFFEIRCKSRMNS